MQFWLQVMFLTCTTGFGGAVPQVRVQTALKFLLVDFGSEYVIVYICVYMCICTAYVYVCLVVVYASLILKRFMWFYMRKQAKIYFIYVIKETFWNV